MDSPTPAQIERARSIAANMPGVNALQKCAFLDGQWDDAPTVQSALAAIIETSEAAAKLAESSPKYVHASDLAFDLRNGYHLKGTPNA